MKANEIKSMNDQELDAKETDLSQTLFNLRFQYKAGQLENPRRMTQVKRDIARIKTIKRQNELG